MISREMAEKLREVVKWEPKEGDLLDVFGAFSVWCSRCELADATPEEIELIKEYVWLPRLDQLLEMIEAEGYRVDIITNEHIEYKYECDIYGADAKKYFSADTREDACALALLWIKEGKHGEM